MTHAGDQGSGAATHRSAATKALQNRSVPSREEDPGREDQSSSLTSAVCCIELSEA